VLGLSGLLGDKWHWDAYYQYGHHSNDSQVGNNRINANWALAVDAVTAPNGQVVCRSTLTDPNNGCHPVDLFGSGLSSDSSKMYVNGTSYVTRLLEESVAAVNFSGSPFNSWAGPVAMAAGAEGRWDSATGNVDAISAAQGWWQNAGTPIDGSVTVTEGYLEADVPLAKTLTLNAADRETHYTTTGNANTWKVGLVWDATDMFRLRVTQSHDFRAPNMDELFGPTNSHPTILIDPTTNTQVFVTQHQGGNPNLQPETGDTTTFGVVFQGREQMQGLKTSLDYYHIKIKDAVDIVNPQTILNRCAAGDQLYCQYVTRDAAGTVTDLTVTYLNLDQLDTSGLDLSADYTLPVFGSGKLSFGLIANYVYHLRLTDSAGHTVDRAGQTGLELLGTPGMPRYNINLLTTYAQGPGSVSLQARYIASGTFDPELIGPDKSNYDPNLPNSINRNTVASAWYADLAAKYDIYSGGSRNVELFGAINNMFDKQPPFLPSFHNAIFFDNVGRYYTAGVRIKF
jgi:outer membrane receptor protein involved in Fe transport